MNTKPEFVENLNDCTLNYDADMSSLRIDPPYGQKIGLGLGKKIIRACNAHDELVAALKLLETAARRYAQGLDGSSAYVLKMADNARAALAKTETWESLGRGIVEIEPDQSGT